MSSFETALKRLVDVNWGQGYDHARQGSYIALSKEYLRRSALWAERLDCGSEWPFFNIPQVIVPEFADPRIEPALAKIDFRLLMTPKIGEWYLLWHSLADRHPEVLDQFVLPAPYEPLIVLFERGCNSLYREHRSLFVGVAGITITNWQSYVAVASLASLGSDTLEQFDQAYQLEFARRASGRQVPK